MAKTDNIADSGDEQDNFVRRMGMLHLRMGGCRGCQGAVICWITRFEQSDSLNMVWYSRGPVKCSRDSGKTSYLIGLGKIQNVITHSICSRVSMQKSCYWGAWNSLGHSRDNQFLVLVDLSSTALNTGNPLESTFS